MQARTHPKFWALMEFLQRYDRTGGDGGSSSVCHGIVFVKTRQAVFHVSDMMRRTQQLAHVDVRTHPHMRALILPYSIAHVRMHCPGAWRGS
eukprot:XP_001696145.1 predicted protein [Chlamydomonas reinhardtii]